MEPGPNFLTKAQFDQLNEEASMLMDKLEAERAKNAQPEWVKDAARKQLLHRARRQLRRHLYTQPRFAGKDYFDDILSAIATLRRMEDADE